VTGPGVVEVVTTSAADGLKVTVRLSRTPQQLGGRRPGHDRAQHLGLSATSRCGRLRRLPRRRRHRRRHGVESRTRAGRAGHRDHGRHVDPAAAQRCALLIPRRSCASRRRDDRAGHGRVVQSRVCRPTPPSCPTARTRSRPSTARGWRRPATSHTPPTR
jgi:hypothetical protein